MTDEGPFYEPFGPVYAAPTGGDCPDCECCTKALCDKARADRLACQHLSGSPELVRGCPCPTRSDTTKENR